MSTLDRGDFDQARQLELALALGGDPGRVVGRRGPVWGVVLRKPSRGRLGALAATVGAVLGGPVHLVRRGRQLLVWR